MSISSNEDDNTASEMPFHTIVWSKGGVEAWEARGLHRERRGEAPPFIRWRRRLASLSLPHAVLRAVACCPLPPVTCSCCVTHACLCVRTVCVNVCCLIGCCGDGGEEKRRRRLRARPRRGLVMLAFSTSAQHRHRDEFGSTDAHGEAQATDNTHRGHEDSDASRTFPRARHFQRHRVRDRWRAAVIVANRFECIFDVQKWAKGDGKHKVTTVRCKGGGGGGSSRPATGLASESTQSRQNAHTSFLLVFGR